VSGHAFFAPSAAHRWVNCPGSLAYPENTGARESSAFADDGTASHEWAAKALHFGIDASEQLGAKQHINGRWYEMDEERAGYVQMYLDEVRRQAMGGVLLVEHRVDLSEFLGPGQGGTADAVIYQPEAQRLVIVDLKYGTGEKVYAKNNAQLLCYALGAARDVAMLGPVKEYRLIICQPRLGHIDSWEPTARDLKQFAADAWNATQRAASALHIFATAQTAEDQSNFEDFLEPGDKTCRWCNAKARCPKLARFVADSVKREFDVIEAEPPIAPSDNAKLSIAMGAVPLIEQWCRAVRTGVEDKVRHGEQVIGSDGLPYKFVEGRKGNSAWRDKKSAEAALIGQLSPAGAYKPAEIISPTRAKQILGKKANAQMWQDVFEPLIVRPDGRPQLVLGSDERPPFSGAASAADFDEIGSEE